MFRVEAHGVPCPSAMKPESQSARGFAVVVGDDNDGGFSEQVKSAIAFLERHAGDIRPLSSAPGFKAAELDFGVWNKAPDVVAQSHSFPPLLVKMAADCGVALTITVYASDS